MQGFNPRPREGATLEGVQASLSLLVSIHAPVKGRRPRPPEYPGPLRFQSTPP